MTACVAITVWLNPGPLSVWWTWRDEMTASMESSLTGSEYNYTASCWWTHTNGLMGPSGSADLRPTSTLSFVSVVTEMSSSDICSNRIKSSPSSPFDFHAVTSFSFNRFFFCHSMKRENKLHYTKWYIDWSKCYSSKGVPSGKFEFQ